MNLLTKLPGTITRYIIGMWRRRWLVLGLAWAMAAAGWAFVWTMPDTYVSTAQVYLNTDTVLNTELEESATPADFEKRVRVMRMALLTPENLEEVIRETGIGAELENQTELERKIVDLQEAITVSSTEEQYFNISYGDRDPVMAQRVTASIVNLFITKDIGIAEEENALSLRKFEAELDAIEAQLLAKDQEIAAYRRDNAEELTGLERATRTLDYRESTLAETEQQLALATLRRDSLRGDLATTPQFTPGTELDKLKVELATLQSQFNDNYPDIIALKARIAELENAGSALPLNPKYELLEAGIEAEDNKIIALNQRIRSLQAEINDLITTAAKEPEAQARLAEIERGRKELETQRSDLQQSINQMKVTASVSRGGGTIQYRVFEAPKVPTEPAGPWRGLLTVAIMMLGLGAAGGIAFLLTQVDRSYTMKSELEKALGLPVLGSVSPALTPSYRGQRLAERAAFVCLTAGLFVLAGVQYWYHEIRIADDAPQIVAEAGESVQGRTGQ